MDKKINLNGGCYCGNVKYEVTGDILKTGVCHCIDCQHLSGGSSWPFVVVPSCELNIMGDFKEYSRIGASGKKVHAGFCPTCGSTLFGRPEIWPHIRTISASSLNDKSGFSPEMHVWVQDAPEWITFTPNLPKFKRNPTVA